MLFNISIAWLDHGCQEDINELAFLIVDKIYKNDKNTLQFTYKIAFFESFNYNKTKRG